MKKPKVLKHPPKSLDKGAWRGLIVCNPVESLNPQITQIIQMPQIF